MRVIIDGESGQVGFQRLHVRIVGFPVFHFHHVPILLGRMAAFIKRIQIVSVETLVAVPVGGVVGGGVGFAGILGEGDEAVLFPVAWAMARGALVRGGRALLP